MLHKTLARNEVHDKDGTRVAAAYEFFMEIGNSRMFKLSLNLELMVKHLVMAVSGHLGGILLTFGVVLAHYFGDLTASAST